MTEVEMIKEILMDRDTTSRPVDEFLASGDIVWDYIKNKTSNEDISLRELKTYIYFQERACNHQGVDFWEFIKNQPEESPVCFTVRKIKELLYDNKNS